MPRRTSQGLKSLSMKKNNPEKLVKSATRVKKFAEVYTPSWLVKKMLDLLPDDDTHKFSWMSATVLEPSCGNGNFLVEILRRKLAFAKKTEDLLIAIKSIYGIDLLPDNVVEAKSRMFDIINSSGIPFPEMEVWTILNLNIQQGDFLSGKKANGNPVLIFNWKTNTARSLNELRNKPGRDFSQGELF